MLAKPSPSRKAHPIFRYLPPVVLHLLQGIITTILATLYAQDLVPSAVRDCELSTRWQALFRSKDEQGIRLIQDAFQCCGFRSVRDMAWPFPPAAVQCAARFDRTMACQGPWTAALRRGAGVELGLVLAVGLLQVCRRTGVFVGWGRGLSHRPTADMSDLIDC